MLAARAVYQFYLSLLVMLFGMLPGIAVCAVILMASFGLFGLALAPVRYFLPDHLDAKLALAFEHLSPFGFWASATSGASDVVILIITVAILALVLAVFALLTALVAPIAFAVLKAATEDRLVGIGATILVLGAIAARMALSWFGDEGVLRAGASSTASIGEVLSFPSYAFLAGVALVHLVAGASMRAFRRPRLSADAPRVAVRALIAKYVGRDWRRAWRETRRFFPALIASISRGVLIALVSLICALTWTVFTPHPEEWRYPDSFWLILAPALATFTLALVATFWALIRQPGLRLLNVALIFLLLPNAAFGAILTVAQMGVANPDNLRGAIAIVGGAAMMPLVLAVRGFLLAPLRSAFDAWRRALVRSASEIASDSQRNPILLLRAFADDQTRVEVSFRAITFGFGGADGTMPLEEAVAEALFARGPVVALSDPRAAHPPPLGAARDASSDDDWQGYVLKKIEDAQLNVVMISRTENLAWEIDQIVAKGSLERTLFVAPPGYPFDRRLSLLSPNAAELIGLTYETELTLGSGVRVICYDKKYERWTALSSLMASERAYAEAIRIAAGMALPSQSKSKIEVEEAPSAQ